MSIRHLAFPILILAMVVCGCSSGNPASPSDFPAPQSISFAQSADNGRISWGIWEITINPESLDAEVVPMRFADFHVNIRKFLEETPCINCLRVVPPIIESPDGLDVSIQIIHPFAGDTLYTGFDVRGIIMLEGNYANPEMDILTTRVAAGGWGLLNPDGWTPLFNAVVYTNPGILGYSRGKMVPDIWGNPTNTLNAFKAYYSAGQGEDVGGRRAFIAGDSVTRVFQIKTVSGEPFRFWYAVDASWAHPYGDPPYTPDSFPPAANCPEPYRFDISVVAGELYPTGGSVTLGLDIWKHQGWSPPYAIQYSAPDCFDGVAFISSPPLSVVVDKARWEIDLDCSKVAWDPELGAEFFCAVYGTDPNLSLVGGYGRFTIPVNQSPDVPVVLSINPDSGKQNEILSDVSITGENFISGCTVRLEKSGQPDIAATNVNFIDSENLTVDLNLTGAVTGTWNVTVENPGGQTGSLIDGFTVISGECNAVLHYNYLGTGDFSFGTNLGALDSCFVHSTGSDADGEMMAYISGFGGTVCTTVNVDTTTPQEGHGMGGGSWGNPFPGEWPTPISIDIAEETGRFFIVWSGYQSFVEEWSYYDGRMTVTNASNTGIVKGLDTDGNGGWWNAYFPQYGFADGIKHFIPNTSMTYSEVPEDHISVPEAWGSITELICIPDDTIMILTGLERGKIRAWDITSSPPELKGEISGFFSKDLDFGTYPDKSCDMDADMSDPDLAHCRIVIWGNLQGGGGELVKIDSDLNILAGPIYIESEHFQSIAFNTEKGHVTLWPLREGSAGIYGLVELPDGW
ncbi:MAG TPA: hypothetical protein ENN67_02450 [Firmicutes bacterium]|nr:hypothetical protein [Bacillota bacterium]